MLLKTQLIDFDIYSLYILDADFQLNFICRSELLFVGCKEFDRLLFLKFIEFFIFEQLMNIIDMLPKGQSCFGMDFQQISSFDKRFKFLNQMQTIFAISKQILQIIVHKLIHWYFINIESITHFRLHPGHRIVFDSFLRLFSILISQFIYV